MRIAGTWWGRVPGWVAPGAMALSALGQAAREYFQTSGPYLPLVEARASVDTRRFNFQMGRLSGRIYGNLEAEFNDNVNLADTNIETDFSLAPNVSAELVWRPSAKYSLSLNAGVGYRWYMNHPDVSSVQVLPNTRLDHEIVAGPVMVKLSQELYTQLDPVARGEFSGASGSLTTFRRLLSRTAVRADWRPAEDVELEGGYSFSMDRSMNDLFTSVDRNAHDFYLSPSYAFTPRLSLGAFASYSIHDYVESIQNDGTGWVIGPSVRWRATPFLSFTGLVGYSQQVYERGGLINDTSNFEGFSFRLVAAHTVNDRMSQSLQCYRGATLGLGSNFTDTYAVQHQLSARVSPALTLSTAAAYEHLEASGGLGESANRLLFYLGGMINLSSRSRVGLAYSISHRNSSRSGADYLQNRVTGVYSREF